MEYSVAEYMVKNDHQKNTTAAKLLSSRLLPAFLAVFILILAAIAYLARQSEQPATNQSNERPKTWVVSERDLTDEERAELTEQMQRIQMERSLEYMKSRSTTTN
ncbi:MAG: hypothetical protein CO088_00155 [Candidatus Yonathbacteria bacterium CG_4_9_14_0_8_um_filter_46_47]|uniref:Uncharacterized protein n=2 Tax=Parcubacteria group TaxID=1794811 RepID=A0A2M8DAH5_9BACT|nr:MAG: hypothetical protein CO088_00155 [Candidatus Yonathbacteria bacterium CG_4_9_14_0_8_um_filter_46_47]